MTHTPQGYENLEEGRVMDLDNPVPTVLAEDKEKTEDALESCRDVIEIFLENPQKIS